MKDRQTDIQTERQADRQTKRKKKRTAFSVAKGMRTVTKERESLKVGL